MKRSSILFNLLGAAGLIGLLSACGSGGGGATTGTGGATSGSAAASGTVTGFGSVYVNGKKFETNDVEVRHDDGSVDRCSIGTDLSSRCGLKEGMTVKVSGSFNGSSRSASIITQGDTVEGPITTVDVANSTFDVLGQTVIVDNTTRFDSGVSLGNLLPGQFVEVSGFVKSDGTVAASFIERKSGVGGCSITSVCEVKGTVKGHNAVAATFQIGGLTVVYDNTTIIHDMPVPIGSNWNDRFVEVKGTNFSTIAGVPTLTAMKVEPENQGLGNNVDELEVEGFVTEAGTANGNIVDFTIGTTQVRTTDRTEFRGGMVDEIIVGAKMSAEGRFDGTTLIAKHVKFHASVKLEGNIATISGNTFTITGLSGVTVTVNSQTEIKADSGNALNDLLVGNHVRVRGRVSGDSSLIATRVEQRPADTDVDLQGPVQSVVGQDLQDLTILGVTVDTTGISNDNFKGLNDQIIGRAAFFNVVKEGTLVKMQGRLSGSIVTWREAELED
jgi:Domain of unknown function (DUF5666)